jgi:predicted AlkP superfamily pyrophosphatase or phosphodiesterase
MTFATPRRSSRALLIPAILAACAGAQSPSSGASAVDASATTVVTGPAPKLVVLIVVDQLRGDMLERYRADLSGGYARLMNGGAWFTNAFQDHAITETAPGHASTMSGRFPSSTGITSNSEGVVDSDRKLVTGLPNEVGASPDRFRGTTVTDWLTAKDSRTRAFSVSMKDRGAILPIGKSKQQVYWYSGNGRFTTSTYYRDTLPTWVNAFNARRIPQKYAGTSWELSRPASSYPEPDSVVYERGGRDYVFPHRFPDDTLRAMAYLRTTPSMDSIVALFALEGLQSLQLGLGPQTDVMSVSFSATDYIGHAFGPDSREAHENEIRLDQTIGRLIDSLYKLRDSSTVMLALVADHGVSPIPELARERGIAKGDQGLRVSLRPVVAAMRDWIRQKGGDTTAIYYDGETFTVDPVALRPANISRDTVLDLFTRAALRVPGVARVDRLASLRRANLNRDPIARRWVHQFEEGELIDLVITLTRYSYWGSAVATHGTPYDQDAHVPIILYGPWVKPGQYTSFARTVDLGVTLAAIAGATPTERVDGVVLRSAIR